MKLRILIADDHEVVRRGLAALLQTHEGWEICGEAADGREAVEKAKQLKPDFIILDIGMPNLNGLAATRQLAQHDPSFKIIVLTITDSDQVIREALEGSDSASCRRQKLERSGERAQPQYENGGNTSQQYHAKARIPFHPRFSSLCREEQHHSGGSAG